MKLFFLEIIYALFIIIILQKLEFFKIIKEYLKNLKKILIILKKNLNNDNLFKIILSDIIDLFKILFKLIIIFILIAIFTYLINLYYKNFIEKIFSLQFLIICIVLILIKNFLKKKF